MTTNQLAWLKNQEEIRANRAREEETRRANLAKEQENVRSNLAQEQLKQQGIDVDKANYELKRRQHNAEVVKSAYDIAMKPVDVFEHWKDQLIGFLKKK